MLECHPVIKAKFHTSGLEGVVPLGLLLKDERRDRQTPIGE
jgi:hypothetical protein